ncbi:diguanylate cyclase [Marinobacter oulmenensis]|uniref:diguanylate cyclase n=1 Tax=Marinobacter oulmenensis TaxID=643747 RepID=A0A840U6H8_9GAMM|nr:diguanylate cyclase (GGDEF)-like protein [Marinobacter oulmenensis]
MARFLVLIMLLCLPAATFASGSVTIGAGAVDLDVFPMAYFVDESGNLDYEQVRTRDFIPSDNELALGTRAKTTWSRIHLVNESGRSRQLFLHHPYAYHNRVAGFYLERAGELIDRQVLDLDRDPDSSLMYRGTAIYEFELPAGASRTLYVESVSYSHQWFSLLLLDKEHSRLALVGQYNDIALLVGVLLALIFYNVLLFFAARRKENVFYSLYLVSGLLWIALSYGFIANVFEAYGEAVFHLHLTLITMPIFLILFMTSIFETRHQYPTEHRILTVLLAVLVADFIYGIFDIQGALEPASSLAAVIMFFTMSVAISLFRKGNPFAGYFIVGHSFFLLFNAIAVLYYKGLIGFSYVASHGVGIGITLEALMLAFIIAHRIRILERIKASQAELRRQATTDPLTRLYNRRYFMDEAEHLRSLALQDRVRLCVLAIDADRFKTINDSHGHQVGDRVLVKLADLLRAQSRTTDLLARLGGEEFVILLPGCEEGEAVVVAEKLRKAVEATDIEADSDVSLRFTISVGVASLTHGVALDVLLHRADQALYQAKRSGRNRVSVYSIEASDDGELVRAGQGMVAREEGN